MIPDTSSLAAIFLGEPEAALYTQLIHDAERCLMSAGTFLELSIVWSSSCCTFCRSS